jgi:type I restriction enzyme R subunit
VVEAKADTAPLSEGVGQAKDYAIDMATGEESKASGFPTPQELWDRTFAEENAWRDRFAAIPYLDKGGS